MKLTSTHSYTNDLPYTTTLYMKALLLPLLFLSALLSCEAQLLINEFSATNSDRLLVREPGKYPRAGNTIPWQSADYDDSKWKSGVGPFGFGSLSGVTLGTNVTDDVQGQTPSLYLRKTFSVSTGNAASGSTLQLAVRYNDGFIAFINGVEVARRSMGLNGMFAYRDQASFLTHTSTSLETIDLGVASSLLQSGDNILAIQVHNRSSTDGTLLMDADLKLASGTTIVNGEGSWQYFAGLAEPSGGLVDYQQVLNGVQDAPDVEWATLAFNDSTWISGVGPVGYETANPPHYILGVDLTAEMRYITPSVYVRNQFTVTQAEADSSFPLSLEVDFDDGMIVYINGNEVFRDNVGTPGVPTSHSTEADMSHPATGDGGNNQNRSQTITLSAAKDVLVAGDNIVGIQLHNSPVSSSDLIGKVTLSTTGSNPRAIVSPTDPVKYFVGLTEPAGAIDENSEDDIGTIEEPPDSENDWIEIRNTSASPVSLDGWFLSDKSDEPLKWNFPAGTSIPANGYYVVIASDLDLTPAIHGTSYAHTSFKLSASSGQVVLSRPDGTVEDTLAADYPTQNWRYTYGRQSDGTFGYLSVGTPGAANIGPALGAAPEPPVFSTEGGFHASSQNITLTSPTTGATIRYTTDGTDPIDGTVYSSPINVTTNTVIRARAFLSGSIPSNIITHTYLINQGAAYQSIPAMILSGDPEKTFYGSNASGGPANGEGVFAINGGSYSSGSWSSTGATTDFNIPMSRGRAHEKYGALEYLPLSGDPLRTELGMRTAGSGHTRQRYKITDPIDQQFTSNSNSATKFEKPSLNIFFRSDFGDRPINYPFFDGYSVTAFDSFRVRAGKNDWHNPFIKDELIRRLYINTGQIGSYGTIHTLWINGVYKGYYNTAERVRENFLQAHFNSNESWDVQQVNSFASGDPTNWNKMINYLRTTDLSTTVGYAGVHDYLDVDNYIDYILVNAYSAMGDWPHNNWIASRERTSLGRWRFHVWDAEGAFGFSERNSSTNMFTEHLTLPSSRYPTASAYTTNNQYVQAIYTLLKNSPEFRLRMADRAQKHLYNDGALVTSNITAAYNELKDEVSPIILETTGNSFNGSWHSTWIANNKRFTELLSQLGGENAWPSVTAPSFNQHGGTIAQGFQMTLSNPNGGGTIYYTTDGTDPRALGGAIVGNTYSGAVTLTDDTRVRARVRQSGTWSPEIDVEFNLPFANPTFMPQISADWTEDANWSSSPAAYPNGAGQTAVIPGITGGNRSVSLRNPVTINRLVFDLETTIDRSRVRDRDSGNTLTFSESGTDAEIQVKGSGAGYAELEVAAGTILASDLTLNVEHLVGDPEFGALRLRSDWTGPGGLIKSGSGIASLSGSGKNYTGATTIERGVLRISEPATPSLSSSVTALPGGQLRLTSGTGIGDPPRNYAFGGTLYLSGFGRGDEISDNQNNGKLGALRYEPGNTDNSAIISSPVELIAPADIHVSEATNRLELSMPLAGTFPLTKSGGGTLILSGDQSGHSYPINVDTGSLEISGTLGSTIHLSPTATLKGHGRTAAISGEGLIVLNQTLLEAPSSNASHYSFVFSAAGAPTLGNTASTSNATVILEDAPTGILGLDFYLTGAAANPGAISQGGIIIPFTKDLYSAIQSANIRVFIPNPSGTHTFEGQLWSLAPDYTVTSVAAALGQASPFEQVKILEVTNGASEPTSFEAWRQSTFNAIELSNPLISGPQADAFGEGVNNLLRYAFGVPDGYSAISYLPILLSPPSSFGIDIPFESGRHDLTVIIESTDNLSDWSSATILFDSSIDFPPTPDAFGRITVTDPRVSSDKRFYRVRVIQK